MDLWRLTVICMPRALRQHSRNVVTPTYKQGKESKWYADMESCLTSMKQRYHARGVEANSRPRLPLAPENDGTGDFTYTISPSMVLVDVVDTAYDLCE
jgi:hypothetical protein